MALGRGGLDVRSRAEEQELDPEWGGEAAGSLHPHWFLCDEQVSTRSIARKTRGAWITEEARERVTTAGVTVQAPPGTKDGGSGGSSGDMETLASATLTVGILREPTFITGVSQRAGRRTTSSSPNTTAFDPWLSKEVSPQQSPAHSGRRTAATCRHRRAHRLPTHSHTHGPDQLREAGRGAPPPQGYLNPSMSWQNEGAGYSLRTWGQVKGACATRPPCCQPAVKSRCF